MDYQSIATFVMEMAGTVAFAASGAMVGVERNMEMLYWELFRRLYLEIPYMRWYQCLPPALYFLSFILKESFWKGTEERLMISSC